MRLGRGPSRQRFVVDVETADLGDGPFLNAVVDRIMSDLDHLDEAVEVQAGASSAERTVFVRALMQTDSPRAALDQVVAVVEQAARQAGCAQVRLSRSSCEAERATDVVQYVDTRPEPATAAHLAAPSAEAVAAQTALIYTNSRTLARQFQAGGNHDLARSIERWLQPGLTPLEALHGLRNELISLRGTHAPFVAGLDGPLDRLLTQVNQMVGVLRGH